MIHASQPFREAKSVVFVIPQHSTKQPPIPQENSNSKQRLSFARQHSFAVYATALRNVPQLWLPVFTPQKLSTFGYFTVYVSVDHSTRFAGLSCKEKRAHVHDIDLDLSCFGTAVYTETI